MRAALAALALQSCSASGFLANAMAESSSVYSSDDDPELVRDAIPFALKTMEGVLVEQPEHRGLLLALASGFTQYGYAFVQQDADAMAEVDIDRSLELQGRAKKLYLRARGYALRAVQVRHKGFDPKGELDAALGAMTKEDVPELYWLAASWGLAISASKDNPEMLADFPTVEKLARRALALDEAWNEGAIHELLVSIEAASPAGSKERARQHFEKALAISKGAKVGTYVSMAESVSVKEQKAKEFNELLDKALAVDVDAHPEHRLANTVMKRRAQRLKAAAEDLFLEPEGS